MPSIKDLPCWEIMNCSDTGNCPARKDTKRSCWEIARELSDYRAEFDICPDCIVYVVKNTNLSLSAHEINQARENGHSSCVLKTASQ